MRRRVRRAAGRNHRLFSASWSGSIRPAGRCVYGLDKHPGTLL